MVNFIVLLEEKLKKFEYKSNAMSMSGAKLEARNKYPNATVLEVKHAKANDSSNEKLNALDKAIRACDQKVVRTTDDISTALENFKKTAEYGDSMKVSLGNGKTAIVQKEYDGWYANIDGKRVKGNYNVILGYLKSSSK